MGKHTNGMVPHGGSIVALRCDILHRPKSAGLRSGPPCYAELGWFGMCIIAMCLVGRGFMTKSMRITLFTALGVAAARGPGALGPYRMALTVRVGGLARRDDGESAVACLGQHCAARPGPGADGGPGNA